MAKKKAEKASSGWFVKLCFNNGQYCFFETALSCEEEFYDILRDEESEYVKFEGSSAMYGTLGRYVIMMKRSDISFIELTEKPDATSEE